MAQSRRLGRPIWSDTLRLIRDGKPPAINPTRGRPRTGRAGPTRLPRQLLIIRVPGRRRVEPDRLNHRVAGVRRAAEALAHVVLRLDDDRVARPDPPRRRDQVRGELVVDGERRQAYASGEVVLSAGVMGSPKVLILSGVGPADHLREVGVEVEHDLPGVRKNLHDHTLASNLYESK